MVKNTTTEKEQMQHDVFDIDRQTCCPECGSDQLIGDYEPI